MNPISNFPYLELLMIRYLYIINPKEVKSVIKPMSYTDKLNESLFPTGNSVIHKILTKPHIF